VRHKGQLIDELAGAMLDGTPIDWAAAESSADGHALPLLRQLRVVAAIAELHRSMPPIVSTPSQDPESVAERPRQPAPEHWAHLRLLERIGRGAFGEVYRAWDTRLDREVALKLLAAARAPGDRASSIIHEGRLLARVRHPNVVTIYGAEQIGDQIGLWMEFVRGETLEQLLEQRSVLTATEAVDIGLDLCRAVSAVHSAGLLHRDIKAHNVMRAEDGRIVLMDFGTGRELDDDALSDLAGTPLYLAPEVLQGQPATVRSDLYSLGVLLYHLVTGSYPVQARRVREIRRAHERGERTPLQTARRDVPSKLTRIIERAVDPRPERRYQSAEALREDLAAAKPRSRTRLVRLAYAAGVAAVLILVGAVGWEALGRQVGSSSTPSALLARFAGINRVNVATVSPTSQSIIAVLPLKRLSTEPESDYFVDGLTDEIIQNLAGIQGLHVRSRTSSFAFKDRPRNLREVGEQLGANLVLDGSVLRSGSKLRINVQLFQVAGEVPLWAERFDRNLESAGDVSAILDEISRAIVNKLRLRLGRGQRRYDLDLETYERYLKARALADSRGVTDTPKAVELFEQVVATDPTFAPAFAGLANAYAWRSITGGIPFETAYPAMRTAAVKALQLDPLLAEAHGAMGVVYSYDRDWADSDTSFRKAIELNPTLTQVYTSYSFQTLLPLERFDEADRLLRVAMRNDPLSLDVWRETGVLQFTAGRYEDAVATFKRIRAVDPEYPFTKMYLARALMFAGSADEGLSLAMSVGKPGSRNQPLLPPHFRACAYVMAGRRDEAQKLAPVKGSPYSETIYYTALGDMDRAFDALERAAVREPQRVPLLLIWPETAALRKDPRLAAFRKKFGLP
jgi:serine/threonine-protein kinase